MSKTVTCLYQDQQKASEIVRRLEQAGISRGDISFYSTSSDNLIDDLENDGVPRTDAHAYAEGVRRGGSLVAVECDEDEVDRVVGSVLNLADAAYLPAVEIGFASSIAAEKAWRARLAEGSARSSEIPSE